MFSTKASCGPFITISFSGFEILRCLNPFTSMSKPTDNVSTNKAQLPELTPLKISLKEDCCLILFCGIRQS